MNKSAGRTRLQRCVALQLLVMASGCVTGPRVERLVPATTPAGARVEMKLGHRASGTELLEAEVLEVRDTAVVVLAPGRRVTLIGYAAVIKARCPGLPGGLEFGEWTQPAEEVRERLRLVSRFPGGLTPQLFEQLLQGYGQTVLVVRLE